MLCDTFTPDEIHQSLFQMFLMKAPGFDGLPALFYQKYWSVVGNDVTAACLDFLNHGGSLGTLNHTLIALILKVSNANLVSEFRPLQNSYKNVGESFEGVLPSIILKEKSAFLPGRQIIDNVIVAFETMHTIDKCTVGDVCLLL